MRRSLAAGSALALTFLAACGERPLESSAVRRGASPRASSPPAEPAGPPTPPAADARVLPIPARAQAPESPPAGWCGETAIQEALLHLGVWAPQRLINKAGKPGHPDLYSYDIPVALTELGVRYRFYAARTKGFGAFAGWVKSALDEGVPVLAGVKILPTEHPDWGLDHFVLVVGHGDEGLLVNTTWGTRQWVSDRTPPTKEKALSFKNAFYGIRLDGLVLPPDASRRARLSVVDEEATAVKLRVTCSGVKTGASYRVERRHGRADVSPAWSSEVVTAASDRVETELTAPADRISRFQCVPVP